MEPYHGLIRLVSYTYKFKPRSYLTLHVSETSTHANLRWFKVDSHFKQPNFIDNPSHFCFIKG